MFHTHPCVVDVAELKISCDDDPNAIWDAEEDDCYCKDGFDAADEVDESGFNHPCVKGEL